MKKPSQEREDIAAPEVSDPDASSTAGYSADLTSHDKDEEEDIAKESMNTDTFEVCPVLASIEREPEDTSEIKFILQETLPMATTARSVSADTTPEKASGYMNDSTNPMDTDTKEAAEAVRITPPPATAESSYVNPGLAQWEKNRQQWLADRGPGATTRGRKHAQPIPVDEIIDAIFTTPKKLLLNGGVSEAFPVAVPLPQLVDILQDLWEAETM